MKLKLESSYQILAWAQKHHDVEVTGFVKRLPDGREVVVPMRNMSRTPETDYAWDTGDMREQWDRMDREHSGPVAFYHSHPGGKSDPSEVDMTAAMLPGIVHLIAYPETLNLLADDQVISTHQEWHLSAWQCLEPGILIGEPLELVS